ncbi:inositol monophosphatase [Halorubrum sp. GN11_10-6_MGM]|uniref:inositol monophosphatase family protein n=1 Tax=Halorubrum sp. GN11_10-6_MGM TaxID=2518112 RepID=UPI0010F637E6|nr:inositol monophosphatase family protein [Halorubrum sp. GN11_10-6_MGM]TKX74180.1 inositol monophosphatase [Halorubrum sp. GN11_10-6_MGM]
MTDHDRIEAVARAAVLAGGAELRARYRDGDTEAEYGAHDVKAAADVAAESRMLPVVREAFPNHAVFAEEAGEFAGTEPYRWIIDPLDGTNDFAAGLPTFASSVAVLRDGEPLVAALHQPATDETYVARSGDGVRYGGDRVGVDDVPETGGSEGGGGGSKGDGGSERDGGSEADGGAENDVGSATVAVIVGRDVPRDPALAAEADALRAALGDRVKRVVDSWAPTVHSGLFARGRLRGLVQFRPDEEEQAVTELLASEAGAAVRRDGDLYVAATDEATLGELWSTLDGADR